MPSADPMRAILAEAAAQELARRRLADFTVYLDKRSLTPPHVLQIAEKLEAIERGEITKLIINMPPRHGKSRLCSEFFPAWFLGRNPQKSIIQTSYSDNLATKFTGRVRNHILSPPFQEVFEARLMANTKSKAYFATTDGGQVIGSGVGGTITGEGADLAIIDDPVKNWEQATSPTIQQKIVDWYMSTLDSRLEPGGAILLIMTRWVDDDLAGYLLENEKGQWDTLILPAIDEKGKALWQDRFSLEKLENRRARIDSRMWSALYQQRPIEAFSRIFGKPIYAEPPPGISLFARLDPAFGGADFNALVIGGRDLGRRVDCNGQEMNPIHIVAGFVWLGQIDETYDKLVDILNSYGVNNVYIESNQAQILIINSLKAKGVRAVPKHSSKNKHFRIVNFAKQNWPALRFSSKIEGAFMDQLLRYSETAKNDDAPDALAGLIEDLTTTKKVTQLEWT